MTERLPKRSPESFLSAQMAVEEVDGLLADLVPDVALVGEVGIIAEVVVATFDGDESRARAGLFERVVQVFTLFEGDGVVTGAVNDEERWGVAMDVVGRAGEAHEVLALGERAAEQLG